MSEIDPRFLKDIVWEAFPIYPKGGQTVGLNVQGVTLKHEPLCFQITVYYHRSQFKNKECAIKLFQNYIETLNI